MEKAHSQDNISYANLSSRVLPTAADRGQDVDDQRQPDGREASVNGNAQTLNLLIDGFEISATSAPVPGNDALQQVRQILLSSFVAGISNPPPNKIIEYPPQPAADDRTFDSPTPKCNTGVGSKPMAP